MQLYVFGWETNPNPTVFIPWFFFGWGTTICRRWFILCTQTIPAWVHPFCRGIAWWFQGNQRLTPRISPWICFKESFLLIWKLGTIFSQKLLIRKIGQLTINKKEIQIHSNTKRNTSKMKILFKKNIPLPTWNTFPSKGSCGGSKLPPNHSEALGNEIPSTKKHENPKATLRVPTS